MKIWIIREYTGDMRLGNSQRLRNGTGCVWRDPPQGLLNREEGSENIRTLARLRSRPGT